MISTWHLPSHHRMMRLFLRSFSSDSSSSPVFFNLSELLQGSIPRPHLLQIHARVYRASAYQDNLIATRLIGHYRASSALQVFHQLKNPNIFPTNAIIRVLSEDGLFSQSFLVFKNLKQRSLSPNELTFSFMFKACLRSNDVRYATQIHSQVLKSGYLCDSSICNGLIVVYTKGSKDLMSACKVSDEMPVRSDVYCWTSLIAGCAKSGQAEKALSLFISMIEQKLRPEDDTMVSVLSACSILKVDQIEIWVDKLSNLISCTINVDDIVPGFGSLRTALVYLYGNLGKIEQSRVMFDEIGNNGRRSVLPWNAMIGAYVQNGCPLEALDLFRAMVKDPSRRPNHVTMVSVLSACGQVGDAELGKLVHEYIKSQGRNRIIQNNTFLGTALIDMYSKCGDLEMAKSVFDHMVSKDVVSFNAMIMGLATNGKGDEAIRLFSKMPDFGLRPNQVTFLSVLSACNHSGLAKEGQRIFKEMTSSFNITPTLEHYGCYIDLLSRVGLLDEALEVTNSMSCNPSKYVWGSLLGGCLIHSRLDIAQTVYNRLVEEDPLSSGGYVMLANAFANDRRWQEVSVLRWQMKEKGVKKQPGRSWIRVNGVVHEFLANLPSHIELEGICCTLRGLINVMKVAVY